MILSFFCIYCTPFQPQITTFFQSIRHGQGLYCQIHAAEQVLEPHQRDEHFISIQNNYVTNHQHYLTIIITTYSSSFGLTSSFTNVQSSLIVITYSPNGSMTKSLRSLVIIMIAYGSMMKTRRRKTPVADALPSWGNVTSFHYRSCSAFTFVSIIFNLSTYQSSILQVYHYPYSGGSEPSVSLPHRRTFVRS